MGRSEYKARLPDAVLAVIRAHSLLRAGEMLVVGVSGGADSLALLHLLASVRDRLEVRLHVATLDHGLRGQAGADDAHFVTETAQAWGIPVTAGTADVRALAQERKLSIETAARAARYDFLASVARAVGAERVAVAHNADDQVETVLLHLLRGSGLSGLAGMAYAALLPGHADVTLIRPLLDLTHADLIAYCREQGLQPRQDATNEDIRYARNRVRHELLPLLREFSPQIERRLLQLAEIAGVEDDFAEAALRAAIDPYVSSENRIRLPRAIFVELHPALQRRFVVWAAHALGEALDVGYVHVTAAVTLALSGEVGARAQLKGGAQLRLDYDAVIIELDNVPSEDDLPLLAAPDMIIPVTIPGETPISAGWTLGTSLTLLDDSVRLAVPAGTIVTLRGKHRGDRFAPLGLGGHTQKLSDWMINHKVPRAVRERLPLLLVGDKIAAVCWQGWAIGEAFKARPETERLIYLTLKHNIS